MNGGEFMNLVIIGALKLKFVPFQQNSFLFLIVTEVTGCIVLGSMGITKVAQNFVRSGLTVTTMQSQARVTQKSQLSMDK